MHRTLPNSKHTTSALPGQALCSRLDDDEIFNLSSAICDSGDLLTVSLHSASKPFNVSIIECNAYLVLRTRCRDIINITLYSG